MFSDGQTTLLMEQRLGCKNSKKSKSAYFVIKISYIKKILSDEQLIRWAFIFWNQNTKGRWAAEISNSRSNISSESCLSESESKTSLNVNYTSNFVFQYTRLHQLFNILICISTLHMQHVLPSDCRTWWRTESVLLISRRTESVRLTQWRTESVVLTCKRTEYMSFSPAEGPKVSFSPDKGPKGSFWPHKGPKVSFWSDEGPKMSLWSYKGPKVSFCMNWRKTVRLTW